MGAVAGEAAVADAPPAIAALQRAEGALDLAPDRGERGIHPALPRREGPPGMAAMHDGVDDAGLGQRLLQAVKQAAILQR